MYLISSITWNKNTINIKFICLEKLLLLLVEEDKMVSLLKVKQWLSLTYENGF